jgi:polar amino acid transport system substrate-binding protein
MSAWKRLKKLLPLAFATAAITGAGVASAWAQSVIDDIEHRGKLMVGMSTFVPWAMRDKKGDLIGFEIDVGKRLAKDMGVEVEFVPTAWSGIIPALIAKKFDVIIGGLSVTPERNLTINFTRPYAHSGQQMAANTKLAANFKKLEDFNAAGVTIACRRGATPCTAAQKMFPKAELRQFDDDAQAFQEVVNGNAAAMISSAPKPRFWADAYPDKIFLPFGGDNITTGNEGFGVRKGDYDAINFFDNWIQERESDGWMKERHDYWFKDQSGWKDMVAPAQ